MRKGQQMPHELVEHLRAINLGRRHTPEAKGRMSAAHRGKKFSAEHKTKIGAANRGALNNWWKGGRFKDTKGYILVKCWGHPFASQRHYVFEHRLVMEQKIGRYLIPWEHIHHINGIRDDNQLENLELISPTNHSLRTQFCQKCELKKEIRLLRWQVKQLSELIQTKLPEPNIPEEGVIKCLIGCYPELGLS